MKITAKIELAEESRNNEPAPRITGGPNRPSRRVDLARFRLVQLRQELNAQLLERSCGQNEAPTALYGSEDLSLLMQIAREHDANGNPAIRGRAIHTLGQYGPVTAELLWQIASSESEHEATKGQAFNALAHAAPHIAAALLPTCLSDKSALIRQEVVNALAETGERSAIELLQELLRREQDTGVRQRTMMAIQSLSKQLNLPVAEVKASRTLRKPHRPESES